VQIPDVPPQLLAALVEAAAGQRLALVGGVVRDLLLHRHHQDPWRGLPDLDLVVEGSAAAMVARLSASLQQHIPALKAVRERHHGDYGTVAVELTLPDALGGVWLLDVASARQELYPVAANNPIVSSGSLMQDLARRDFSVNAMALILDATGLNGRLCDPHGGQADLARRQLRFLHDHSLRDDPTRLVRAARYCARLGFTLAPEALPQVQATLLAWPWMWRPGDAPASAPPALSTRLRMEFELLLVREPWCEALKALHRWGGMVLLDAGLQGRSDWLGRLRWARRFGLSRLTALVANAQDPLALAERLQLPRAQQLGLQQMLRLQTRLQGLPPLSPSAWCELLEAPGCSPQAVALAVVRGVQPRRALWRWWARWRHLHSPLTGRQLMALEGLSPGPALGQRLRELRAERLDQLG